MTSFKPLLSLSLAAVFIIPFSFNPAKAQDMDFLQAAVNTSGLEDYKALESFSGVVEVDDLKVDYLMNFTSTVDNDSSPSSFNRFNLTLSAVNSGLPTEDVPFKGVHLTLTGQVSTINEKDVYFRLDDLAVKFDQASALALAQLNSFTQEFNALKGTWYHVNLNDFMDGGLGISSSVLDEGAFVQFSKDFKDNPEQAVSTLIENMAIANGEDLAQEDKITIEKAVNLFFKASFFNQHDILSGDTKGFKFFTLNRNGVVSFAQDLSKLMGDPMSAEALSTLRASLMKFSMSGMYNIDQARGIIDYLSVRAKLRDMEGLKYLEMFYRFKLLNSDSKNVIQAPVEFKEIEELEGL